MNKTARLISIAVALCMTFSIFLTVMINTYAVAAPVFSVTKISSTSTVVTVAVNLESGSFNALDFNFVISNGVTCSKITPSDEYGDFYLKSSNGAVYSVNPDATLDSGYSNVSMASTAVYNTKGQLIIAELKIPYKKDYSIGLKISSCSVTDDNGENVSVTPKVSSIVSYSASTTTTTKSTTTTTRSTATTLTTTDPKNNSKSEVIGKTGNNIPTGTIPDDISITSSSSLSDLADDISVSDLSDSSLDLDEYGSQSYAPAANISAENKNEPIGSFLTDSHNKKIIIIVAAVAVVLISGAITALVFVNKKNKAV